MEEYRRQLADGRSAQPGRAGQSHASNRRRAAGRWPAEPREYVWVDDAIPAGSTAGGEEKSRVWHWVESPQPVLNGKAASERTATGLSQHLFTGARHPLVIGDGDKLFAHVFLDPANPPEEIMLQFHDGTLGASGLLGREQDRLGQGQLAQPPGRWARCPRPDVGCGWKSTPRRVGLAAGHGRRRLGLHAIRRPRVLGQAGHRDPLAARSRRSTTTRRLGSWPSGRERNPRRRPRCKTALKIEAGQAQRRAEASDPRLLRALLLQPRPAACSIRSMRKSRSSRRPKPTLQAAFSPTMVMEEMAAAARDVRADAGRLSRQGRQGHARRAGQPAAAAGRRAGQSAGPGPLAGRSRPIRWSAA